VNSSDSALFKVWSLGFRALSALAILVGALGALVGLGMMVLSLLPRLGSDFANFTTGAFVAGLGILFTLIGWRGVKIRTRANLDAEIAQTEADRSRFETWVNK
jgi:hypothetical protein